MHFTDHPNVVNYRETWLLDGELWIVTEFLEGGTLEFALRTHRFRERHICYIAFEILNGLVFLHKLGFAHRDLKSANIMMSIAGDIKIIDFGLCCDFHKGPRQQCLGSPFWLPPEMILRKPHTVSADIWSYSILVMEMILGKPPYDFSKFACMMHAVMGTTTDILDNKHSRCLKDPSKEMIDFLKRACKANPEERPTAAELIKDPWFSKESREVMKEGLEKVLQAIFISSNLQMHGMV